jgi:hypothetical protein
MPLFCPTEQANFLKSEKANAVNASATVHGVVFEV